MNTENPISHIHFRFNEFAKSTTGEGGKAAQIRALLFDISFLEFAKSTTGEGGKAAQIRALLFDISFLMLCHITQLYGVEVGGSARA
jgi:mediator of RNA polymerase II transcription subunit 24